MQNLQQWDDGDVAVRAYMLHFLGERVAAAKAAAKESAHAQAQQVSMLRVSGFPTLTAHSSALDTTLDLGSFNGLYNHVPGDARTNVTT